MGQAASSECSCNDGLFGSLCAPQDPSKEAQGTLQPSPVPGYPSYNPQYSDGGPGSPVTEEMNRTQAGAGNFGFGSDEAQYMNLPPPDMGGGMGGLPPPMPQQSGGGGGYAMPPPAQSSASAARREVSADDILSNLEGSEDVLYSEAFAMFPGGLNGYVGLDSAAMRDFICTNSCISMDDIDLELLKVASPDEGLSRDGFVHLLREFAISDGDAISHFLSLSADSETVASEECRSGLLLFAQQKLNTSNFNDDRWERIFNTVMWDAGVTVPMEQWLAYCKLTGRIVRALRYGQV